MLRFTVTRQLIEQGFCPGKIGDEYFFADSASEILSAYGLMPIPEPSLPADIQLADGRILHIVTTVSPTDADSHGVWGIIRPCLTMKDQLAAGQEISRRISDLSMRETAALVALRGLSRDEADRVIGVLQSMR